MARKADAAAALARAVTHLEARDWQAAHAIVQDDESTLAAWLHGIVHTLEGDLGNARYWYRRARREFPGPEGVTAEIAHARRAVDQDAAGSTGETA
jgi:hypothetical protein